MASRDTQCRLLGAAEMSGEGWRSSYYLVDSLAALEPADLQAALSEWAGPGAWGIILPESQMEELEGPWPVR